MLCKIVTLWGKDSHVGHTKETLLEKTKEREGEKTAIKSRRRHFAKMKGAWDKIRECYLGYASWRFTFEERAWVWRKIYLFVCSQTQSLYWNCTSPYFVASLQSLVMFRTVATVASGIHHQQTRTEVNRSSSVSIVSGYGLDDWAIEVRSPAEAKGFVL
jgi:hypothetical protein